MRVTPSEIEFDAEAGQTIMAAAVAAGLWWPTVCGGIGSCHACATEVVEGASSLSPIGPWEHEGLDALGRGPSAAGPARLACQAQLHGDVVVHKHGVQESLK